MAIKPIQLYLPITCSILYTSSFFLADLQLEFQIPCDLTDRRGGGGGGYSEGYGAGQVRIQSYSVGISSTRVQSQFTQTRGRGGEIRGGRRRTKEFNQGLGSEELPWRARASSSQVRVHTHSMNTEQENKTDRCDR